MDDESPATDTQTELSSATEKLKIDDQKENVNDNSKTDKVKGKYRDF